MKKPNSIDLLVENLALEFSKIKDFDLLQNDPTGKLAFNFVVKNAFELNAYKNLFVYSYIPSSLKSSQEYYRELKFSKYKNIIKVNENELKENYYETIRLGYVGAYHKYESYINSLPDFMDTFFEPMFNDGNYKKIELYLKETFKIDLKKTINIFYITKKINWIANCVKHYDGYPIKEPILKWFNHFDKSKRIQIESTEFKEDLENLAKQNQLMLTSLFLVGFYQYMCQDYEKIKTELSEDKTQEDLINVKREIENIIKSTFLPTN